MRVNPILMFVRAHAWWLVAVIVFAGVQAVSDLLDIYLVLNVNEWQLGRYIFLGYLVFPLVLKFGFSVILGKWIAPIITLPMQTIIMGSAQYYLSWDYLVINAIIDTVSFVPAYLFVHKTRFRAKFFLGSWMITVFFLASRSSYNVLIGVRRFFSLTEIFFLALQISVLGFLILQIFRYKQTELTKKFFIFVGSALSVLSLFLPWYMVQVKKLPPLYVFLYGFSIGTPAPGFMPKGVDFYIPLVLVLIGTTLALWAAYSLQKAVLMAASFLSLMGIFAFLAFPWPDFKGLSYGILAQFLAVNFYLYSFGSGKPIFFWFLERLMHTKIIP